MSLARRDTAKHKSGKRKEMLTAGDYKNNTHDSGGEEGLRTVVWEQLVFLAGKADHPTIDRLTLSPGGRI